MACVWERKAAVAVLVRKEGTERSHVHHRELGAGGRGCDRCLHLDPHWSLLLGRTEVTHSLQFPQNPLPSMNSHHFWRWLFGRLLGGLCNPHYFCLAGKGRQPKNSVVVPLTKPFREVVSNTPRESCDLDLHGGAEAIGEAMAEQGVEPRGLSSYFSAPQNILHLHPHPHVGQHPPLSKSPSPETQTRAVCWNSKPDL